MSKACREWARQGQAEGVRPCAITAEEEERKKKRENRWRRAITLVDSGGDSSNVDVGSSSARAFPPHPGSIVGNFFHLPHCISNSFSLSSRVALSHVLSIVTPSCKADPLYSPPERASILCPNGSARSHHEYSSRVAAGCPSTASEGAGTSRLPSARVPCLLLAGGWSSLSLSAYRLVDSVLVLFSVASTLLHSTSLRLSCFLRRTFRMILDPLSWSSCAEFLSGYRNQRASDCICNTLPCLVARRPSAPP
ncbi:hypothetical protein BV25DRAFT_1641928 [Artomyces pyxidatus]|uniref:Uncharacterized protein n=1 Tax=Artomyces pyxidatus TaxID=48021 RepID=A0ACB8SIH4_9AGAM|nr:hypothetical protein BV25DRAFT_1641928 [Artomyces pyxidatus]